VFDLQADAGIDLRRGRSSFVVGAKNCDSPLCRSHWSGSPMLANCHGGGKSRHEMRRLVGRAVGLE
jgi:hypothetical protein